MIVMLTFLDVDTHSIIIASIGFPLRYVTGIERNLEIPSRYVMAPEMAQSVTSIHGAGNKASRSALVDGLTDGPSDGWTHPLIEMLGRI